MVGGIPGRAQGFLLLCSQVVLGMPHVVWGRTHMGGMEGKCLALLMTIEKSFNHIEFDDHYFNTSQISKYTLGNILSSLCMDVQFFICFGSATGLW